MQNRFQNPLLNDRNSMQWCDRALTISLLCLSWCVPTPVAAQILPDETLDIDSSIAVEDALHRITGGTVAGGNLFHSFREFSLGTGETAFFDNALTVENIITRVTGGQISHIDGLLRANGTANLFLLNPSGIVFGPNARLEIGGSFFGSSADRLVFEDGSFYSATEPNASPLLTVNVPVGLQFGANPGAIEMQRAIGQTESVATVGELDPLGLQVQPQQTLALIGGPLNLTGVNLLAEGGRIELGSVAGESAVGLSPETAGWAIDYDGIPAFGNIHIDSTTLRTSGAGGGSISIAGRNIAIENQSNLLAETLGRRNGGAISLNATEDIAVTRGSFVSTKTFATGNAGSIEFRARSIFLEDNINIEAQTQSRGNAGGIIFAAADTISMQNRTRLATDTLGAGQGGFIDLSANTIVAENRARVANNSVRLDDISDPNLPLGDAGQTNFTANTLIFRDRSSGATATTAEGNGGQLNFTADSILVEDRSGFGANTSGTGRGGEINVTANTVVFRNNSGMGSRTDSSGEGGRINVNVGSFFSENQAGFGTDSRGSGNGGEINIRADSIVLRNQGDLESKATSSGNAGTIRLEVGELVLDGGIIELQSTQTGNAGSLDVRADSIRLDNEGSIFAGVAAGDRGNISLNTGDLQLRGGSSITTSATGTATGGNIRLNSDVLVALDDSDITANAILGTGGNIDITASGIFLSPDSQITASSQLGVDGIVRVTNPDVDPSSGLIDLPSNFTNASERISEGCADYTNSQFIVTGRGGLAEEPMAKIRGETVWHDWQDFSQLDRNSQVRGTIQPLPPLASPMVEATGWITNDRGQVELVAHQTHSRGSGFDELDCGDLRNPRSSVGRP